MRPPQATQNAYTGATGYCSHCSNHGMVILDEPGEIGAPCPMCTKGAMIDAAGISLRYERPASKSEPMRAVGTGERAGFWRDMPESTTWERGLTVRHIRRCQHAAEGVQWPCGMPAVGQWCDHHNDPANRVQRERSVPLGRLASAMSAGVSA